MADFLTLVSQDLGAPIWLVIIILIWVLTIKALALWRAARLNQPIWFVILIVVNTFGILEVLYLFLFSKMNFSKLKEKPSRAKKRAK